MIPRHDGKRDDIKTWPGEIKIRAKVGRLQPPAGDLEATAKYFKKQDEIFKEIAAERIRQDEKYGKDRNLPPGAWLGYIENELEEVWDGWIDNVSPPHDYRTEMIQLVALGVAAIESWDRQKEERCTPESSSRRG